ncbi:hypothetical protein GE21DRAFT_1307591 [Neurospora crassa]|nr:hypothetical protein GE21DRAFT_1307591 [Neurospora crassa]
MTSSSAAKSPLPPLSGFSMFLIRLTFLLSLGLIAAIVHIDVAIRAIAAEIDKLCRAIAADLAHILTAASNFGVPVSDEEGQRPKGDKTLKRKQVHFAEGTKPPSPDKRLEVVSRVAEPKAAMSEALDQSRRLLNSGRTLHARFQAFRLSEANRRAELEKAGGKPRKSGDLGRVRSVTFRATRPGSLERRAYFYSGHAADQNRCPVRQ